MAVEQDIVRLPFGLRYRAAYDPKVENSILRTFIRTLQGWRRRRAMQAGIADGRWGAVTVVQRGGFALRAGRPVAPGNPSPMPSTGWSAD